MIGRRTCVALIVGSIPACCPQAKTLRVLCGRSPRPLRFKIFGWENSGTDEMFPKLPLREGDPPKFIENVRSVPEFPTSMHRPNPAFLRRRRLYYLTAPISLSYENEKCPPRPPSV